MPQNYTGSTAFITPRQNVTITEPAGTDVRNSASVRTPLEQLADVAQYLMQSAALLDQINAFWRTVQIGAGNFELTQASLQSILKKGSGKLDIGTASGNSADLEFLVNGVVMAVLRASDGKLQGQSTAAGDIGTTLVSKDYIDAKFTAPAWQTGVTWGTAWAGSTTPDTAFGFYKDGAGIVRFRGAISPGSGYGATIFTAPTGLRPSSGTRFYVAPANTATPIADALMISVAPSGAASFAGAPYSGGRWYYLDGISYTAA